MDNSIWHAWFDGATKHSNPGIRGIGAVLKGPAGQIVEIAQEIGQGTNNEAEYCALMAVLDAAVTAQVQNLIVYGDSQLVIKQVNGEWLINAPGLVHFCKTVLELKALIPNVSLAGFRAKRMVRPMRSRNVPSGLRRPSRLIEPSG